MAVKENGRANDGPAEPIVLPFLKWPGGKRWFATNHRSMLPSRFNTYLEPFLGSGSVFFALRPKTAILSDANEELINVYHAVRHWPAAVLKRLQQHASSHSDNYYYEIRADIPTRVIDRAARTIYLNRTCFNGIYRVNLDGIFNVPRGTKDSVILETDDFAEVARVLRAAEILVSDFEAIIDRARRGDLVFADPPYTVRHNTNGFIKYNEKLFSWNDQERLAAALARARNRGAHIIATNANHESVRDLYEDYGFNHCSVSRFSSISATGDRRKQYEELVISSHSTR